MLLYTSGSTGRPKGVVHTHRNVLVDARNLANGWRVTRDDRWLLYASLSFANSVRTVYGSLLNGASVYPFDVKKDGFGGLKAWMTDNEITIVRGVPTFFRSFMASASDDASFPSVRILSLGGEPMLAADLGYFERHFSPRLRSVARVRPHRMSDGVLGARSARDAGRRRQASDRIFAAGQGRAVARRSRGAKSPTAPSGRSRSGAATFHPAIGATRSRRANPFSRIRMAATRGSTLPETWGCGHRMEG